MGPTEVFVSRYARALTVTTWALALVVVGGFAGVADRQQLALAAAGAGLAGLAAWAIFWRPRVVVSDGPFTESKEWIAGIDFLEVGMPISSRSPSMTLPVARPFGGSRPISAIEDCVLPEPDSPTMASTSPGWTS